MSLCLATRVEGGVEYLGDLIQDPPRSVTPAQRPLGDLVERRLTR